MDKQPVLEEKLRVFVSSTITECSAERKVAKEAITSLNHQPFLFETAGARPYPPPELFFTKLDEAHIFVGIYKDSYGWVAPSATQSGLDLEFQRARKRGMRRLFYIARDGKARDPRLIEMLKSSEEEVTFSYFDDSTELFDRIRDDIEAVVAGVFHRSDRVSEGLLESADVADSLGSPKDVELRPGLTAHIAELQAAAPVNLYGEQGAGKTYQLLDVARKLNGFYVAGRGYDRHLLASVMVNTVRQRLNLNPEYFISPDDSFATLLNLWNDDDVNTSFLLDDVDDELFLSRILREGKPIGPSRSLVTTSVDQTHREGFQEIELGGVDPVLAQKYLQHCLPAEFFPKAVFEEQESLGLPLFLQYLCSNPQLRSCKNVDEIDTQIFNGLREDVQELISYVALGEGKLQLAEATLATGWKPSNVLNAGNSGSHFLRQTETGFQLRHPYQREVLQAVLTQQPLRRKYLQRRLARALNKRQSPLRAFQLLEAFGDPAALRFAPAALFEAAVGGDNKSILRIANRRLSVEKNIEPNERVALLLTKSMAERQAGDDDEAAISLEKAKTAAQESGTTELTRDVRFLELYEAIYRSLRQEDLLALEDIVDSVDPIKEPFIRARFSVDLSALYMHLYQHEQAAKRAREALELFRVVEDEYGEATAKKNLVTALTKGNGNSLEIEKLSRELEEYRVETDSVRDRAWFCNLRTRQCRLAGQLEQAFAYASEAIEIAEKLGDARLVALNRINLGNVRRDQDRPKDAVKEYLAACKAGAEVGDRHMEAQASRLASAAFLDGGDPQAALASAQYAVARVDGTTAVEASIDALEQLGDVQIELRDHEAAADAYGAAFWKSHYLGIPGSRLLFLHLSASSDANKYMAAVLRLVEKAGGKAEESADNVGIILKGYDALLKLSGGGHLLELTGLHLALPSERLDARSLGILFERLLGIASSTEIDQLRAMAMLSLFVTIPLEHLAMRPIVEASEVVSSHVEALSFRPRSDGAAHWVISLRNGYPLLLSISVIDDRPSSCLLAVALALFLWRFESELKGELLAGIETPKQEVQIVITHVDELPPDMRSAVPDAERGVSVSRVTRPSAEDRTPTMVFYDDHLLESFKFADGETSGLLVLLLMTLSELCHQLFLGEVDEAQLKPKIVKLLRRAFR
jgi:tetratricopeptide (TPR) repeat protein